jgi:hypothetical protein
MTNRDLLNYDRQNEELAKSVVFHYLRSKINEFYRQNGIRIDTIKTKTVLMQKEYFVFEGDEVKYEGEGKDRKPVLLEGKRLKDFQEALNTYLSEETTIIF